MFYPKRDKVALKEITNFYRKIFDFERNCKMFLLYSGNGCLGRVSVISSLTVLTDPSLHLPALTALTGPSLHLPTPHCTYRPLTAVVSTFTISAAMSHSPSVLTADHTCGRAWRVSCHDDTRLDPSFETDSA